MPDFVRTTTKAGFRRSPFTTFKEEQQVFRILKWFKKFFLAILLLGFSLGLSLALISFLFLRLSQWKQQGPLGVVFLTSPKGQVLKETTLLWVDPNKHEIRLLTLPPDVTVHTAGNLNYSLKALYGLYAINHATPVDFLKALSRNVRIDMPFFIVREGQSPPKANALGRYMVRILWETRDPGSFPLSDRFALLWYVVFGRAKVTTLQLPANLLEEPEALDDLAYDDFVQTNFLNLILKNESYTLAVVNASSQARLASTIGRLFTDFGLNVLSVGDTPVIQDNGAVYVKDGRLIGSATQNVLSRYISGGVKVDKEITNEYRADIVVFLGKKEAAEFTP